MIRNSYQFLVIFRLICCGYFRLILSGSCLPRNSHTHMMSLIMGVVGISAVMHGYPGTICPLISYNDSFVMIGCNALLSCPNYLSISTCMYPRVRNLRPAYPLIDFWNFIPLQVCLGVQAHNFTRKRASFVSLYFLTFQKHNLTIFLLLTGYICYK